MKEKNTSTIVTTREKRKKYNIAMKKDKRTRKERKKVNYRH